MTVKPYGFDYDEDDEEVHIITRFKARFAIVLSASLWNQAKEWPTVMVAPIFSIHDEDLGKEVIDRIIARDKKLFAQYYLEPRITGKQCYIDLRRLGPVPKNWLLQEKTAIKEQEIFDELSGRIGVLLAQKKLAQCDNCERNCRKCGYRTEVQFLREQLKKLGA